MKTVQVRASGCYEIRIGSGILEELGAQVRGATKAETAVVVAGEHVFSLYGDALCKRLEQAGFRVLSYVHAGGESAKSLETYVNLLRFLSEGQLTRSDVIVALGGGVTGDLAGFTAATYQRGMDFIQLPTSLLSMVDSSVGGKTGVNLPTGKNQVGCFYQPKLVLCDPAVLRTLPEEEYRCGCAEIIKYAMLRSAAFMEDIYKTPVSSRPEPVIEACVTAKRDLVEEDEYDHGRRQLLNLGHSFGHAVEACSGYTVLHGKAVAIGMAMVTRAAVAKGICEK